MSFVKDKRKKIIASKWLSDGKTVATLPDSFKIAEAPDFVNKNPSVPIELIKIKMSVILSRSFMLQVFISIIVLLVLGEFLMFSYLSKRKVTDFDVKRIKDYETILCKLEISIQEGENPPTGVCPAEGIVTAFKHWSLSTNMWMYANVIALSIATSLRAYVPVCLKDNLDKVFANLSLPTLSTIGHCVVPLSESVGSLDEWKDITESIVINESEMYSDVVMKYLDIACHEFVFSDSLKSQARDFLTKARSKVGDDKTVVYIAVYITKTTIILNQEFDDLYPSVQFFMNAMNYFRKNYDNAVFVVITDREDIWRSIFKAKDIFIVGEDSLTDRGTVLSVLSHCNHTILSSDGGAIWAAILAGGETVISVSLSEDYNSVIKHFKQWIYVTNDSRPENRDGMSFH